MQGQKEITMNISIRSVIKVILVILILFAVWKLWSLVLAILTAIVIASLVQSFARNLQAIRIPRFLSLAIVYVFIFGFIGLVAYLVVPAMITEFSNLIQSGEGASSLVNTFGSLGKFSESGSGSAGLLVSEIRGSLSEIPGEAVKFLNTIFGGLLNLLIITVLTFYFSATDRGIDKFVVAVTPVEYEQYILSLWRRTERKIAQWFRGQLVQAMILAVLTYVGLAIIGVPYPLMLSLLAGLLGLVPFGIWIAGIVAVVIGWLNGGLTVALFVLLWYALLQILENNLLQPLIIGRATGVPSLVILISVIAAGSLWGFLGVILAIPMAVFLMELIRDYEAEKRQEVDQRNLFMKGRTKI